jgi:hypothetical protein
LAQSAHPGHPAKASRQNEVQRNVLLNDTDAGLPDGLFSNQNPKKLGKF